MNLRTCNIATPFIFSLVAFLIIPIIWPTIKLFFFAPFIIITLYQLSYIGCLWTSLCCGLAIDCLSVHPFFGLNAFTYTLTTFLLYPQRVHFFSDRASTLPLMTAVFSFAVTVISMLWASIFERKQLFSWNLLYTDLFLMPLADSLYALIFFVWISKITTQYLRSRRA
ncbi:MAG: mreD [Parachlamydiaceae bacterium]|nr:mreD [Parachlamydiaceae bacterium]